VERSIGFAVVLGLALATPPALTSAEGGDQGQPLTKEQYFERSLVLSQAEPKLWRLYYSLAATGPKKPKCVRRLRNLRHHLETMVERADAVTPPAEIEALHNRVVAGGAQIARRVSKLERPTARGRARCGTDLPSRVDDVYYSSDFDPAYTELQGSGYIPSGY
jgi:hypothetical protein